MNLFDHSDVADRKLLEVDLKDDRVTIKRAYMRLALKLHPDKSIDARGSDGFIQLHLAYQRILHRMDAPITHACMIESMMPHLTSLLMQLMGFLVAFMQSQDQAVHTKEWCRGIHHVDTCSDHKPPTLVVNIDVSLDDVYHARVKKLIVKVNKHGVDWGYRKIMIPLVTHLPSHFFEGMGDESDMTGDVCVNVHVQDHVSGVHVDNLIDCFDLHITVETNVRDLIIGKLITLKDIPGGELQVWYGGSENAATFTIIRNRGLPYLKDGLICRGDLYVFFDMCLPSRPSDHLMNLHSHEIRIVLDMLVTPNLEQDSSAESSQ